jgi:RNA polymerase sigma factor (sigma-70 family)
MTPLLSSALLRAQTDERLVELAASGHDRAFEAIVERYRRPLLRYLRRLLSDTLAEDVVQATFINAWSSMRAGTEVRDLRPWLYRIAHNAAINALKKVGEAMEEMPESVGGFATEPATELERRDEVQRALTHIAALPSRQRAALLAVAVDGRAHSDVAAELGLTDGAVRQLVHRARTTLRTGVTALTPMPLLHSMVASAGDSTVARVAEVAAGAGGAGAASVSLKAGAAAVLATGALVTGGPEIAHVVRPAQKPERPAATQAPAQASSSRSRSSGASGSGASAAAPADHDRSTAGARASSSATSHRRGRSHRQRRRGRDAGKSTSAATRRDERAAADDRSGSNRGGSTPAGTDDNSGPGSSGRRAEDESSTAGRSGRRQGSSGKGSGGSGTGDGRGESSGRGTSGGTAADGARDQGDDLVVTTPKSAEPEDKPGDDGGNGATTTPAAPTQTTPPPPVETVPTTPAPSTVPDDREVRTVPSGGGSGGSGG